MKPLSAAQARAAARERAKPEPKRKVGVRWQLEPEPVVCARCGLGPSSHVDSHAPDWRKPRGRPRAMNLRRGGPRGRWAGGLGDQGRHPCGPRRRTGRDPRPLRRIVGFRDVLIAPGVLRQAERLECGHLQFPRADLDGEYRPATGRRKCDKCGRAIVTQNGGR